MSRESGRTADDAKPECLDGLGLAVKSFRIAPYGAQLVIRVIAAALVQHEDLGGCALCDSCVSTLITEVVDSESVQLGVRTEVIARLDDLTESYIECIYGIFWRCYAESTNKHPGEVLLDRGHGYTKVTRGVKWLVECALLELKESPIMRSQYDFLEKALEALLIPQPIYDSTKDYKVVEGHAEIFSLNGVTSPALRIFTTGPHCDEAAIEYVVEFVMREAVNVAAIWDQQVELNGWGYWDSCKPSYAVFVGSFVEARARFKAAIEATPTPGKIQETFLPYHVRAALKEVAFVDLWQYWWEDARDIQGQTGNDRNAARMYETILDSALLRG